MAISRLLNKRQRRKPKADLLTTLEPNDLVLRASKTPRPDVVDRLKLRMGQGITGWVAEHRQSVAVASGASQDPRVQLFDELRARSSPLNRRAGLSYRP